MTIDERWGTPWAVHQSVTGLTEKQTTIHTHIHMYWQFRVAQLPTPCILMWRIEQCANRRDILSIIVRKIGKIFPGILYTCLFSVSCTNLSFFYFIMQSESMIRYRSVQ